VRFFLKIRLKIFLLRTHDVQFPFFLHGEKMFVEAGGILSLCNYSWKLDLRLWWYTRMVCSVCFLASCKVFIKGGGILSLCNFSLKIIFGIVLLCTHGVQYLFSCKMENSWLRQCNYSCK